MVLPLLLLLLLSPLKAQAQSVFAHVVVGTLAGYTQTQWAQEISDAAASGIDAFALNIAKDLYTNTQLQYAYAAAESANFKLFISFDFSNFSLPSDTNLIVQTIQAHASSSAQYKINNQPLVTTFSGDNQDWSGVKSQVQIFLAPNWANANSIASNSLVDGGYPWNAWGAVNNRGVADPTTNMLNQDSSWRAALGSKPYFAPISPWFFTHYVPSSYNKNWIFPTEDLFLTRWQHMLDGKPYFAPISPWFFTHYAPSSYNKNWIFPTEDLFLTRWQHMLDSKPYAVYQLTWNDYSESSYVAPLRSDPNLYPAGASAWTANMPHDGFRIIQNAFAKAYKAGSNSPVVDQERIVYWYRIQSKNAQCSDSTDRPDAYNLVSDTLFVTTLLRSPAQLVVTSGGTTYAPVNVGAGGVMTKVPIQAGQQSFAVRRNGQTVISNTSAQGFSTGCPGNVYNFNAYVGVV